MKQFNDLIFQKTFEDQGDTEVIIMKDGTKILGGDPGWFTEADLNRFKEGLIDDMNYFGSAEEAYEFSKLPFSTIN